MGRDGVSSVRVYSARAIKIITEGADCSPGGNSFEGSM